MNLTPWLINHFREAVTKLEDCSAMLPDSLYFLRMSHPAFGNDLVMTFAKEEDYLELRIYENPTNFFFYSSKEEEDPHHQVFRNGLSILRKVYDLDQDVLTLTHDGEFCWVAMEERLGEICLQPKRAQLKELIQLLTCFTEALPLLRTEKEGMIMKVEMNEENQILSSGWKPDRIDVEGAALLLDEEMLAGFHEFKRSRETIQVDLVSCPDMSLTLAPERMLFKHFVCICSNRHEFHEELIPYCEEDLVDHLAQSFQEYFLLYGIPQRIQINHPWLQFTLEPFCQQLNIQLNMQAELVLCTALREELSQAVQLESLDLLEEMSPFN